MRRHLCRIFQVLACTAAFLTIAGCVNERQKDLSEWQQKDGLVWNTSFHITYRGAESLGDSALSVLSRVGRSLSVFDSTSLVSKVNRQDSTLVDTDFIRVYVMSRKINRASDGAFDPTLSPLITAWGFGKGHKANADTTRIDSILNYVGINKTHLHRDSIIKNDPRIEFNFSAIAKGYGCDAVAEMFEKNGVTDFLIEIGGEIMTGGKNKNGKKWRISIDRPILSSDRIIHESQEIIDISGMGVATSGNYRNFHNNNSGTYGHTISAATGRPVSTDVISATVIAPTAMEADGLATAFMAMGSVKARKLNESLRRPVLLVLSDSTTWSSIQFDKLIVK